MYGRLTWTRNVDRLFALWQVLNPDTWVEPTPDTFGTYFESPGFIDTSTSGKINLPKVQLVTDLVLADSTRPISL